MLTRSWEIHARGSSTRRDAGASIQDSNEAKCCRACVGHTMSDGLESIGGVRVNRARVEVSAIRWADTAPPTAEHLNVDGRYSDPHEEHRSVMDVKQRRIPWGDLDVEHPDWALFPNGPMPRFTVDRNRAL